MEYCSFPSFSCSFSSSSFSSSVSPVSPSSSSSSCCFCGAKETKRRHCVISQDIRDQNTGLPITASMPQTLELQEFFFYMGDTCFGYCLPAQHLMIITTDLSLANGEISTGNTCIYCLKILHISPSVFLDHWAIPLTCLCSTVTARVSGGIAC